MTREEFEKKYKDYPNRDEMTEEMELQFVADCFACYEEEGFAATFWSQDSKYSERNGMSFTVVGRIPMNDGKNGGSDLECLPMWLIRFEDGFEAGAFPEEIVSSEMRANGCPEEYLSIEAKQETIPEGTQEPEMVTALMPLNVFCEICGYFYNASTDNQELPNINNGYNCRHPECDATEDGIGCCFASSCPLSYPADGLVCERCGNTCEDCGNEKCECDDDYVVATISEKQFNSRMVLVPEESDIEDSAQS